MSAAPAWVRIACPFCRATMPPPFPRIRAPISNTHPKPDDPHGSRCRVIVIPDPVGDQHEVHRVPSGQRAEDVMQQLMTRMVA